MKRSKSKTWDSFKKNCKSLGNGVYITPNGSKILFANEAENPDRLRGLHFDREAYYIDDDVIDEVILNKLKEKERS